MIGDIWEFTDGTLVIEDEVNYLPVFDVYDKNGKVARAYPRTREDADDCIDALNDGENPLTAGWEDGYGNLLKPVMQKSELSYSTEILQNNIQPSENRGPRYILKYKWSSDHPPNIEMYFGLNAAIFEAEKKLRVGDEWVQVTDASNGDVLYDVTQKEYKSTR